MARSTAAPLCPLDPGSGAARQTGRVDGNGRDVQAQRVGADHVCHARHFMRQIWKSYCVPESPSRAEPAIGATDATVRWLWTRVVEKRRNTRPPSTISTLIYKRSIRHCAGAAATYLARGLDRHHGRVHDDGRAPPALRQPCGQLAARRHTIASGLDSGPAGTGRRATAKLSNA